jgi:hypothetical protein
MRLRNTVRDLNKSNNYIDNNKSSSYGIVTSVGSGTANVQSSTVNESRDMRVVAPQGISSCPSSGVGAQTIINDDGEVMIGVNDPNRPIARPGEIIIYSGSATISVYNGNISINGPVNISGSLVVNGRNVQLE